jgi:hypothetical protein
MPSRSVPSNIMLAALALLGLVAACTPPAARPATFRARPDSVEPGDLRGPFDGKVVDSETERPVAGATVYAVWSFVDGYGFPGPSGYAEKLVNTDAEGRYKVPRLDVAPKKGARLGAFHLVVFKRGYVAYRSDRRFEDLGPRLDFTQRRQEVRLERWRSDISHVKHLRYVGGGATLAELTKWEIPEAAAELAGRPSPGASADATATSKRPGGGRPTGSIPVGPPLPAQQLLVPADVAEVTGFSGEFDVGDLGDEPPSPQYNSVHLRAKGQPEAFDVAARIWHVAADEADALFDKLTKELPGVKESEELGDRSLRAVSPEGDILGFAFVDKTRGVVVLVQCGASQCRSGDQVLAIAKRMKDRADALFPAGGK